MSYRDPPEIPVEDPQVRAALTVIRLALMELARQLTFRDVTVTLPNNTPVTVFHGLGRVMKTYVIGAVAGATATGRLVETGRDPSKSIELTATGFGATVTVPVRFW